MQPQRREAVDGVRDGAHGVLRVRARRRLAQHAAAAAAAAATTATTTAAAAAALARGRRRVVGDVEEEALERRPRHLVVAAREQLRLAAELEGHRARHDPLRAAHHLAQHHRAQPRGEGDRGWPRCGLRHVREQKAAALAPHERLDCSAPPLVSVDVVGLVHDDQLEAAAAAAAFGPFAQRNAPTAHRDAPHSARKRLAQHMQPCEERSARRGGGASARADPCGGKCRECGVASDKERRGGWVGAEQPQELVQRHKRLPRSRWRHQVHVLVLPALLQLLGLVRRQRLHRERRHLVLLSKLRGVGHRRHGRGAQARRPYRQHFGPSTHAPAGLDAVLLEIEQHGLRAVQRRSLLQSCEPHRSAFLQARLVDPLLCVQRLGQRQSKVAREDDRSQLLHGGHAIGGHGTHEYRAATACALQWLQPTKHLLASRERRREGSRQGLVLKGDERIDRAAQLGHGDSEAHRG